MSQKMKNALIVLAIVVITIFLFGSCISKSYNKLVTAEETVSSSWSNVGVQLQRRNDLIPNLVSTVKGYASHEKDTLTAVVEARAAATSTNVNISDADAMAQFQSAQSGLSSALSKLMVVVEKYPDLKANQNFRDLQNQLEGTENRITVARKDYNTSVKIFNSLIRRVPTNMINNMFLDLEKVEYFEAVESAEVVPVVEF